MNFQGFFYREKPLFALDFGHSNLKVMQLETETGKRPRVSGFGLTDFPSDSIQEGVIVKPEVIADALYDLFKEHIRGTISTRRVACTIPTGRTFSRPMKLPLMEDKDVKEAVRLETEQYIPLPSDSLYIDYEISSRGESGLEVLAVATPKNIIDSHIQLLESMGLEPVALEPTMNASSRLFSIADPSSNEPSILMDYGSISIDLAVFDKTMFVNSTIVGGGNDITAMIAQRLNIGRDEAYNIKNNYGIAVSEKQGEIIEALQPILDNLVREIQKIIRYYDERKVQNQRKIAQVVTIGGGANMPGLNTYLSDRLQMPVKLLEPWSEIDFGDLPPPDEIQRSMFITVIGAALLNPMEIFA